MKPVVARLFKIVGILVTIGLLAVVVAWLAGVFHETIPPAEAGPQRPPVGDRATVAVRTTTTPVVVEALGSIQAKQRTTIAPEIPGRIVEITVRAGDRVAEDEVLIRLATADQERRVRQAERALEAVQARLREAERDFARTTRLLEEQATTQAAYDTAVARLEALRAEAEQAAEAVAEAEVVLGYATVRAPRAGRIVDRFAQPGDVVQAGTPVLSMYDPGTLRLEAPVAERVALALEPGMTLPVRIDALDRTFDATIDEIVPQADAASRSLLVKVLLPEEPTLFEGLFGRLLIQTGERDMLCIPRAAVQSVGQLDFVEVVRDDETLERRYVTLGERRGCGAGAVEVLSGVAAGATLALPEPAAGAGAS
jgi:RND family efflux transporter MFP subunit